MKPPRPAKCVSKVVVFLSYRSVEARFADLLKQHLLHDFIGLVDVFLASDTASIPAGTSWHSEILEGLRRSDLHIVICSKMSVRSPWINYEAGAAAVLDTLIMPLCHSGLVPDQLPVPLSEKQGGVITEARSLQLLYDCVASLIGSAIPAVNFEDYAAEFAALQQQLEILIRRDSADDHVGAGATMGAEQELLENPYVVCVTSPQFETLGLANQLETVRHAFPKTIRHEFVRDSMDLKRVLLHERVDIVHIAAFVCPRGGDLYFSPVSLPLGGSDVVDPDVVSPEVLVSLLRKANTRLVVLAGSASLVLGAQLLPVANVIAVRDMVSPKAMAIWVETFYTQLVEEKAPLAHAFELASQVSQAPMKLYAQQRNVPSFQVQLSGGGAAVR